MVGEKNEREVVRVENAQYNDRAGRDTHWGPERCALITRNTTTGRVLHTGDTGGIDAYLFGIVDGLVYLCTQF